MQEQEDGIEWQQGRKQEDSCWLHPRLPSVGENLSLGWSEEVRSRVRQPQSMITSSW